MNNRNVGDGSRVNKKQRICDKIKFHLVKKNVTNKQKLETNVTRSCPYRGRC